MKLFRRSVHCSLGISACWAAEGQGSRTQTEPGAEPTTNNKASRNEIKDSSGPFRATGKVNRPSRSLCR